jgi:hypothetical protein
MMEFLLYLSPTGQEIYQMISRKVRVVENTPICRKHNIYGWFDSMRKEMTFCTDTIKQGSSPEYYVNETLFHESVHVAQSCKNGNGYMEPFGISPSHMPLSEKRWKDVNTVVSAIGNSVRYIEQEAFWMEDKPDKVKYVVQKYCF